LHGKEETKVNMMPEDPLREIQKLEVRLEDFLREEDAFAKELSRSIDSSIKCSILKFRFAP